MKSVARRYRKFPMFTMPAAVLGAGVTHVPSILLLFFFDSSVLGVYSQAVAILLIPLSQVGAAVAQVFFVRAVEARRAGSLDGLSATVHGRLVSIALFPAGVAMIAAPDLFHFLFGETWRASGEYLLYLSPWIMLTVVSSPLTRLFDVLERQRLELLTAAAMLAIISGALVAGGLSGNVERTLLLVGVGGAVVRSAQIVLLMRLSGVRYVQIVRPYAEYALLSAIPLAVLAASKLLDSLPLTLGSVVLVSAVYAGFILKRDGLLADRTQ
jgi:O-antigen/teichoic acid export membrane protein